MVKSAKRHAPTAHRRGGTLGFAAVYYLLVGLVAAALAAWLVLSTAEVLLTGSCDPGAYVTCLSVLNVIAPAVALVAGATLLATAWRLRRDPPRLGALVYLGAVVGVAVVLLPILFILAMSDSLRIDIVGSPDLGPVLIFTALLVWALHSAVMVRREANYTRPEA